MVLIIKFFFLKDEICDKNISLTTAKEIDLSENDYDSSPCILPELSFGKRNGSKKRDTSSNSILTKNESQSIACGTRKRAQILEG